jgi:hypothetical protein
VESFVKYGDLRRTKLLKKYMYLIKKSATYMNETLLIKTFKKYGMVAVSVNGYILGISQVDRENRDITISMYLR